eukprot:Hpha_TRINITY_DN20794_c0_g1::TRINITY_DN20794_c0_g1_i1::g.33472::m.33472
MAVWLFVGLGYAATPVNNGQITFPSTGADTLLCAAQAACQRSTVTCDATYGCHITCSGDDSCKDVTVACGSQSTCTVECTSNNACDGLTLTGGSDGAVTLSCSAQSACKKAQMTCPTGAGICALSCDGKWACDEASLTSTGDGAVTVGCSGEETCFRMGASSATAQLTIDCACASGACYACRQSTFQCPRNRRCDIACTGEYVCNDFELTGGLKGDLKLKCSADRSCKDATVTTPPGSEGVYAVECTEHKACEKAKFDCPEQGMCTAICEGEDSCQDL